ncbi:hypothetical protein KC842_02550 [Candidatus Nomurabacteria bacterium]|nr:hypothetical protein [Candidatus Nomurabacteria bacterium]
MKRIFRFMLGIISFFLASLVIIQNAPWNPIATINKSWAVSYINWLTEQNKLLIGLVSGSVFILLFMVGAFLIGFDLKNKARKKGY